MTGFTSTREGFERAMALCLTGPQETARQDAEKMVTPDFYQIINDRRIDYETYVAHLAEWRGKTSDYKPKIEEFLRDGDLLAARLVGTIKVEGVDCKFESFLFAKVAESDGRMTSLIERSIWGPIHESST
ncbi:hypothetical protein BDZ85DRAFT_47540 [Elsinoe ampelina]|uniref:SnoaL-like domain-containing protein n=1 Tax=Elsinoe ampelina TaxID=302913 RepID=A0A6A6GKF5_9PEZI|nr:hypothetical protein BDZ85DRAFT_47540 [Elsinoe ampelina]